jgi:alpha-N-arabinofuranosidase
VILKEPRVTNANHLPLCQDVFGALIGIRGTYPDRKNWRNAVYYVFQMYARMRERDVLNTTVESPVYSTPAMGFVSNLKDIPYIDTSAYRTKDGKKLSIFLINRDVKRSASVTVDTSFDSFEIESITTLTANSYKDENTPEKLDNAIPTKKKENTKHSGSFTLKLPKHSLTEIEINVSNP